MWRVLIVGVVACSKGAKAPMPPAKPAGPVTVAPGIVRTEPGHYALTVARSINADAAPIKTTLELSPGLEQRIHVDGLLGKETGAKELWPNVVVNVDTDNLPPGGVREWYSKSTLWSILIEDSDGAAGKRKVLLRESLPDRELVSRMIVTRVENRGQYFQTTCLLFVEDQGCAVTLVGFAGPADQALLKDYEATCRTLRVIP